MPTLPQLLDGGRDLLAQGGPVLPWILGLSTLMWLVMMERWVYLRWRFMQDLGHVHATWAKRHEYRSRTARRLRAQYIADLQYAARRHLPLCRTMVQVLPLLGLLGTVIGLVHTFEIITLFGGANRRGIATGISEALIATLSGLLTALSGLLFTTQLESRANAACLAAQELRSD